MCGLINDTIESYQYLCYYSSYWGEEYPNYFFFSGITVTGGTIGFFFAGITISFDLIVIIFAGITISDGKIGAFLAGMTISSGVTGETSSF